MAFKGRPSWSPTFDEPHLGEARRTVTTLGRTWVECQALEDVLAATCYLERHSRKREVPEQMNPLLRHVPIFILTFIASMALADDFRWLEGEWISDADATMAAHYPELENVDAATYSTVRQYVWPASLAF